MTELKHPHAFARSRFEARVYPRAAHGCAIALTSAVPSARYSMDSRAAVVNPKAASAADSA